MQQKLYLLQRWTKHWPPVHELPDGIPKMEYALKTIISNEYFYFNTYIAHTLFIFIRLFCPPPIDVLRQFLEMKLWHYVLVIQSKA